MPDTDNFSEAFTISLPIIIKANTSSNRRIIEVEASNEITDSEGDVVLQRALLDASPGFLRSGVLDVDHISEIGRRIGIYNTSDWIVGVPLEVKDIGKGRTSVVGELHQPKPGIVTKADEIWDGITRDPPVRWRASIYGFPKGADGFADARVAKCPEAPSAKRYVVKALDWRSMALTQRPINDAITGQAHVVTMKAHIDFLRSTGLLPMGQDILPMKQENTTVKAEENAIPVPMSYLFRPRDRTELLAHHSHHMDGKCPFAGVDAPLGRSVAAFRQHFMNCVALPECEADIMALALMQALKHERK